MIKSPAKPRVNPREYRKPMAVTEWQECHTTNHWGIPDLTYYAKCPRCKTPMEYDYVRFCSHCGQRLAWRIPLRKKPR